MYPGTGFPVVCKCSSIGRPRPTACAVMAHPVSVLNKAQLRLKVFIYNDNFSILPWLICNLMLKQIFSIYSFTVDQIAYSARNPIHCVKQSNQCNKPLHTVPYDPGLSHCLGLLIMFNIFYYWMIELQFTHSSFSPQRTHSTLLIIYECEPNTDIAYLYL